MLEGAGTLTILPQLGTLLGFTALFLVIAVWQFKFE
jgi:hypothetical protein